MPSIFRKLFIRDLFTWCKIARLLFSLYICFSFPFLRRSFVKRYGREGGKEKSVGTVEEMKINEYFCSSRVVYRLFVPEERGRRGKGDNFSESENRGQFSPFPPRFPLLPSSRRFVHVIILSFEEKGKKWGMR